MHNNLLVLQSDFGLVDGAVSAMIGVALEESPTLKIHHLTHDITPYNIFEGSYRLFQTVDYWPEGTTFVSVVDPGVGSKRKSVVAKTAKNQYIVTPDNGTLSFIKKHVGIVAIREISEVKNRRANTEFSYTFHGRDVYAYTGAKLASGHISFEEVGPELSVEHIVEIPVVETVFGDNLVKGAVDILDVRFGSLWTSITREEFNHLAPEFGERFEVTIYNNDMLVYQNQVTYGKSFADVRIGQPILYINSLYRVGLAINQGSFAKAYNVGVGASWHIEIRKMENLKQKSSFSIKDVVAIGVGAALFVVIAMLPIPAPAPNTSIQLQYALQALFSVVFGPIVGFLMGLIGHAIKDAMAGGLWWTWIISSGLFGLFVGIFRKQIGELKGEVTKKELILFNVVQIVSNLVIWGLIAPVGDILIYKESANKVFLQGVVAGSFNALTVAIAGSILLIAYARTQTKDGSLSKD